MPPSHGQPAGFLDASLGRHFLYTLYQKLLKSTWTRHHSSHPQPWQSIADLLSCSGLVQSGCTASLSLFWECGKIFMYYRRLTIKISLSAPLSLGRRTAALLPPVVGSRNWGSCPYSSWSDGSPWEEETQPHLGIGTQGTSSLCLLPRVVLSMIKSEGNIYSHRITDGAKMVSGMQIKGGRKPASIAFLLAPLYYSHHLSYSLWRTWEKRVKFFLTSKDSLNSLAFQMDKWR